MQSVIFLCDLIKENETKVSQIWFFIFLIDCMHRLQNYILQQTPLELVWGYHSHT